MSKDKTPAAGIQVIQRMAQLLDAIAARNGPVSLKILAAETGLHPSTAFRILASLADVGFVDRMAGGAYSLGIKFLQYGHRVRAGVDVRREARPVMEWLRDQVGESVNLTLREGDEVVYVERVTPARAIRVEQVIGSRAPLHVTAVGKLMLGAADEEAVREYAARTGLPRYTRNTLTDVETLRRETARDIQCGYALDNEEAELGVGCIGALIRDNGGIAAGLSVSAPIERRREEWIPLVLEAARRISERLGFITERKARDSG